jgi:hypothetical protein
MPEDLSSSIYIGSMDDHSAVVVESLGNSYFPNPKRGSNCFHLSCSLGCHLRGLRIYHQSDSPWDAPLELPARLHYAPTQSKIDLRASEPIDMFPELPIQPTEGIWVGSVESDGEEGKTPLGFFLFRYVAADEPETPESESDDGMSDALSMSWASSTRGRDVDLDVVMDLAPPLNWPPSPSRKRPGSREATPESVEDVRYELHAYCVTGSVRIPRGERLFRAQLWEPSGLSVRRDNEDDEDELLDLDEIEEFAGCRSYPVKLTRAQVGYSGRREVGGDAALIVIKEGEVALFDGTGNRERVWRFVKVA